MKNKLFFIICIIFFIFGKDVFSADLVKIGEFNCSTITYLKKFNISAYKLFGKNRKLLKEMKGTYLTQILKKELSNYNEAVLSTAVFKAYSKSGKSVNFTYNEISENLAKIPLIIGFSSKVKFQDSIEISGYEGTKLNEKQKSKFDDIFTNFQVYKVYLQFNSIPKDSAETIFKNNFIILPMDKFPDRWLGDLEKIEIYQLK
jgi:hypothetical protein